MEFSEFGLHPDLLDGIEALNFKTATPIQEKAIPLILEGKDLIGTAQTGTGKTAAFVLPIMDMILKSGEYDYTQALIIVPTRELAVQIDQAIAAYSYFSDISSAAIYGGGGGKDFAQGRDALQKGADIVIATPGRLLSHMSLGYVDFSRLRFLVLDEADRMLDMGFLPDLNRIIKALNPERQSLLFSATMPHGVMKLAKTMLRNPVTISIALSKPAEGVTQGAYLVNDRQKLSLIAEILKDRSGQRTIVFCSSKQAVNQLFQKLKNRNMSVERISSDLEQTEREQVMLAFRNSKIDILVATDVLSRGIDIDGIDLVINFDAPRDAEDYVHRIGRTARAERKGTALTLINHADLQRLRRIEKLIGKEVPKLPLPPGLTDEPGNEQQRRRMPVRKGGTQKKSESPRNEAEKGNENKARQPFRGRRRGGKNQSNKTGPAPTT
ncbi:MAG: DEAD/DEAH box helicase [Saprospiraceae bacterium]|nr:DEAD/DEAH box helicase [Saprospiraceae bacterium]